MGSPNDAGYIHPAVQIPGQTTYIYGPAGGLPQQASPDLFHLDVPELVALRAQYNAGMAAVENTLKGMLSGPKYPVRFVAVPVGSPLIGTTTLQPPGQPPKQPPQPFGSSTRPDMPHYPPMTGQPGFSIIMGPPQLIGTGQPRTPPHIQ